MKRIIYLLIIVAFIISCDKMIDIEYNTNVKESTPDLIWKGTWDGKLSSIDKKHEYGYTLTITEYSEKSTKGILKISKLPERKDFIIYSLEIERKNNDLLKIKTLKRTEEKGSISFCDKSIFNLELSNDKRSLTGVGNSEGDCLITDSIIKLEKK